MSVAVQIKEPETDVRAAMREIGRRARAAARELADAPAEQKNRALHAAARLLRERSAAILSANALDLAAARAKDLSPAMIDQLALDHGRIERIARGLEEVAALPDPVGRVLASFTRPNGLVIDRVATPLGVVGVIYESRPNVTADAGALCLKSGNAVVFAAARTVSIPRPPSMPASQTASSRRACRRPRFRAPPPPRARPSARCSAASTARST